MNTLIFRDVHHTDMRSHTERGNEENFWSSRLPVFLLLFCVPLRGVIELNVSGVSQAHLPVAKKSSYSFSFSASSVTAME